MFRTSAAVVNLSSLDKAFAANASVTPSSIFALGLIARTKGKISAVKILANGTITKALSFYDCQISAAAKEKIVAAGGTVN